MVITDPHFKFLSSAGNVIGPVFHESEQKDGDDAVRIGENLHAVIVLAGSKHPVAHKYQTDVLIAFYSSGETALSGRVETCTAHTSTLKPDRSLSMLTQ
ncbi:hypothetical protein GJ744_011579 [Endocarpon pusillum]|uniref:Uncharacterized protein n=1 Tax=Endocarpon pusillum TaxID=364733 RepID=A0A8H7AGM3_9EURO|nr:hypothetical protein GJ744_011579 [Endocarpon pusillum]